MCSTFYIKLEYAPEKNMLLKKDKPLPLLTPSSLNATSLIQPSINSNKINFLMKYKGKRTSGPPPRD
jgi:hypothetical protein